MAEKSTLTGELEQRLMDAAEAVRLNAYAPYSRYLVGAALLGASGRIYTGCNVESATFTPTVCAERTALFKAVSEGERDFTAIAIVGGREGEVSPFCAPCGVCRQMLAEFCPAGLPVLLGNASSFSRHTLGELLPFAFTATEL